MIFSRWGIDILDEYLDDGIYQNMIDEKYLEAKENQQWIFERKFLENHIGDFPKVLENETAQKVYQLIDTGNYDFKIKRKLGQGVYGKIYEADNTAIKIQKCCALYHDIYVGYFLNKLHSPNFQKIFGFFTCENEYDGGDVLDCQPGDKYVEGITLGEWLKEGHTDEEICLLFLCIFGAFEEANEKFKFTHYDLHRHNILSRIWERRKYLNI